MTEQDYLTHRSPLSEMWSQVNFTPETRQADLLAIAWSRRLWAYLSVRTKLRIDNFEGSFEIDRDDMIGYDLNNRLLTDSERAPERYRPVFDVLPWMFGGEYPLVAPDSLVDELVSSTKKEFSRPLHDIYGNPFRWVDFEPLLITTAAYGLAHSMYESRDFAAMPILADALEEAGCNHTGILSHCRDPHGLHVRGCWVVDGVLGKT